MGGSGPAPVDNSDLEKQRERERAERAARLAARRRGGGGLKALTSAGADPALLDMLRFDQGGGKSATIG